MSKINELKEIIANSDNIVFFFFFLVSTESGILDFRSEDGIYKSIEKYGAPPEVILSRSYFRTKPEDFYKYYKENLIHKDAKPNDAHLTIAKLEEIGKMKAVVTQNIDGLHQKAGSKNVLELHGTILKNHCMNCESSYDLDYIIKSEKLPTCTCGGLIKPDVVLYEEPLDNNTMTLATDYIANAETLIIGGTSLVVYPAAGLIQYFKGENLILINKSATEYDSYANLIINEAIGEVFKEAVK
jgi:NAD-dependent deacetylase